jgi:hypothetical protein
LIEWLRYPSIIIIVGGGIIDELKRQRSNAFRASKRFARYRLERRDILVDSRHHHDDDDNNNNDKTITVEEARRLLLVVEVPNRQWWDPCRRVTFQ